MEQEGARTPGALAGDTRSTDCHRTNYSASRLGRFHGDEEALRPEARLDDVSVRDVLPHELHVRGVRLAGDEVPPAAQELHGIFARPDAGLDPVRLPELQVLPDVLDDVHELLRVPLAEDLRGHLRVQVHDPAVERLLDHRLGGAEVVLCASNPLSTQDDTAAALVDRYGADVYAI